MMKTSTYAAAALLAFGLGGCSLINSLDDVKQSAATSGSGGSGATGASGPGGAGGAGGSGGGGMGGVGGSGGMAPGEGLIVVSGTPGDGSADQLLVLDGASGVEVAREDLLVTAAVHDPATDTWYVFETSTDVVDPSTTATLHSRKFDRVSNTWTTEQSLALGSAAPLSHRHLAILSDRLVFAHYSDTNPFPIELATVDVSDPKAMMTLPSIAIDEPDMTLLGVIGNPTQTGGTVNLIRNESMASLCRTNVRLVNVINNTTTLQPSTLVPAGTYACSTMMGVQPPVPGWALNLGVPNEAVLVVPTAVARIVPYQMSSLTQKTGIPLDGSVIGRRFLDVDVAPCQQVAVFVEHLTDQKLYAVPLTNAGQQTSIALGHSGQWSVFEPYNDRVLDFYDIGAGFALKAFALEGTDLAPELSVANQGWTPPSDFRARFTLARDAAVPCPND